MKQKDIQFVVNDKKIKPSDFTPFFIGWSKKPNGEKFLRVLKGSYCYVIARHKNRVIGFINTISDGILTAYIPLLEVLPEYQSKGVGTELTKVMVEHLKNFYMIDVVCDRAIQPFYKRLGLKKSHAMILRNCDKI